MDVIENLLSGTLNMQDFLEQLKHDPELQQFIRGLIPEEAIQDSNHAFWKIFPYASLRQNHFDFMHFLFWALQSRGTIGNHLTIFSRLRKAYLYHHPDVPCTRKYEDAFDVYLDVVTDCFDGPEVREITERIVWNALSEKTKTQRVKQAKVAVKVQFHVEGSKRLRWIQGPEWPMGVQSTMVFREQKRGKDSVNYYFEDAQTGELKVVTQFF